MDIFDLIHKMNFDKFYGGDIPEEDKEILRKNMKSFGIEEQEIENILSELHLVKAHKTYGHAHLCDIEEVVERALFRQSNKSITLKISKEGEGHLTIEVIELIKNKGGEDVPA